MTAYFLILLTFRLFVAFLVPVYLSRFWPHTKNKAGDMPALLCCRTYFWYALTLE